MRSPLNVWLQWWSRPDATASPGWLHPLFEYIPYHISGCTSEALPISSRAQEAASGASISLHRAFSGMSYDCTYMYKVNATPHPPLLRNDEQPNNEMNGSFC